MGKVIVDLTMSVDGFIAGPNDGPKNGLGTRDGMRLHDWLFNGPSSKRYNDFFRPKGINGKIVNRMFKMTGAFIFGRRTYNITHGWNGSHPVPDMTVFILTHKPPKKVPKGNTRFIFVEGGIKSAVSQAKKTAGKKEVLIQGASAAQQALKEGLVDQLYLHIANRILGKGVRLFENLGNYFGKLKQISSVAGPDITHIRYTILH